jgi:VWFA-related protein
LVDDFFALKHDRDRVLSALRDQLGHMGPRDRMAVVAYDGKQLEMLSSWSQSRAALERALREAERRPAYGLHRVAELRSLDHDRRLGLRRLGPEEGLGRMSTEERFHAERLERQLRRSVSAASATLRAFAAPPGRKVMLVLSGGWPNRPADFVVADLNRPVLEEEMAWGEALYRPLTETANLLGYTLYTVEVPGLRHQAAVSAEESAPRAAGAGMAREMELRYTLEYLAQRTGGRPLLSAARTTALEEAVLDTRSYYWLGFTADRQGDDQRRSIEVEVLRPGLRVRHRDSFQDFSRQAEVTMAVESGLLFGNPPSSQALEVSVGEIRSSRRAMEVPLEIKIPLDAVTVLPAGDRYVAQLELRVGVRDDQGETVPVPVIPVDLRFDEEPEAGSYATYETELRLRAARHDVVVALYDPLSGALLSAVLQIAP